jgi:hypothetical protein
LRNAFSSEIVQGRSNYMGSRDEKGVPILTRLGLLVGYHFFQSFHQNLRDRG